MQRGGFSEFYARYIFLICLMVGLLFFGLVVSILYDQRDQFMVVNRFHCVESDAFFRFYTHLGDGLVMVVLGLVLLFKRIKYGILMVTCFLTSGLMAQLIKHGIKTPRPGHVFAGNTQWYALPDYHIHGNHSFPSGHTTTAFALMILLYYIFPSQRKNPLFFILACLCGYSRIYLSQHWVCDVFVGALLGTAVTAGMIYWFEHSRWYHQPWSNRPLGLLRKRNV